jgi:glutaredoxin
MTRVVLYARPDCHLCDDARAMLERARATIPFALEERNIEDDDALLRRHLERIPVIEVDGEELFELVIDEEELRAYLARVHSA